ncbi:MAG TPA: hypothetical protein PLS21_08145, partial [Synergistales bacterium]|nr:hypothetical protein [Synergistales bacterium]
MEDVMQKYLSAPCGMIPSEAGEYVKLADVSRETIPRPDPDEARKAVDELISAATCFEAAHSNPLFGDYKEESIAD